MKMAVARGAHVIKVKKAMRKGRKKNTHSGKGRQGRILQMV